MASFPAFNCILYKRSVLIDNKILFPKGIKLIEDKLFNARFFCYAKTIALMDDVLYNYVIKEKGLLTSPLNNVKGLVEDKIIGIEQRAILRNLYLKEKNIDIFSYYIGTIVFSALELIMRLSDISFFSSRKELKRYMNMEDVRSAGRYNIRVFLAERPYSRSIAGPIDSG